MNSANGCNMRFKLRTTMAIVALIAMVLFIIFGIFGTKAIAESTSGTTISKDDIIVVYKDDTSTSTIKKQLDANDSSTDNIAKVDSDTKYAVADVPDGKSVNETIKQYEKNSSVEYAQPNYLYKASSYGVNDTYLDYLYHLGKVFTSSASTFYSQLGSKSKAKVAILDTGVSASHQDLENIDIKNSVDVTESDTNIYQLTKDPDGHGTHVAGIVAATANNNIGVAGVASTITNNSSNIDVFVTKVFKYYQKDLSNGITESNYYADTADLIKGLRYVILENANVINMSLGMYSNDMTLDAELDSCEKNGISVVCSAGNDNTSTDFYPSDYSTCISVTASDEDNSIASYSNHNKYKDITAPGSSILSTYYDTDKNENGYAFASGTSMAAPVVTGIVASMYSVDSALTPAQVRQILYDTATDLGTSGWDQYYGHGLVNADKAIKAAYALKIGDNVTARFDVNGGSPLSTALRNRNLKAGSTLSTLPTAKRKGYILAGWYDGTSAGDKITASTMITADKTYYAHWTKVTVSKAKLSSVRSKSRKIYAVSKKTSGAKGYQLRRSTYKSFKKSKYTTKKSNKITTGKLTRNKYYYIKVRAYKLDSTNSKIYGSWSSAKKVKVKS